MNTEDLKIIRVFPRRTSMTPDDDYAFVGEPPMIRPDADEVHVSCTFTWDVEQAKHLVEAWKQYYLVVKLGGPAFGCVSGDFVAGRYIKQGVTFTSRGCNNNCPPCLVPEHEGRLLLLNDFPDGSIIQDNNFAQCPKEHRMKVYRMLDKQPKAADFKGGVQASLVTQELADEFRSIRIKSVFFACDRDSQEEGLKRATDKLSFLGRNKLFCYTLIGENGQDFGSLLKDRRRLGFVYHAGCLPFAQLYQPADKWIDYHPTWKHLRWLFSRPAATKSLMKPKVTLLERVEMGR